MVKPIFESFFELLQNIIVYKCAQNWKPTADRGSRTKRNGRKYNRIRNCYLGDVSSKVLFGERYADIVKEIVLYLYECCYRKKKTIVLNVLLDFSRFNNVVVEQKCSAKGRTRQRRFDARFSWMRIDIIQ